MILLLPSEDKTKDEADANRTKNSSITIPIEFVLKVEKLNLYRDHNKERKALLFLKELSLGIDPNGSLRDMITIKVATDEIKSHFFESNRHYSTS